MKQKTLLAAARACGFLPLVLILAVCGCKAQRYVEGVEMSVGISVPGTDGAAQISFLEYISGIKVSAGTNTDIRVTYKASTSNDYFGVVHVRESYDTRLETAQRAQSVTVTER